MPFIFQQSIYIYMSSLYHDTIYKGAKIREAIGNFYLRILDSEPKKLGKRNSNLISFNGGIHEFEIKKELV